MRKEGQIASLIDNNNTMQVIGCLIKNPMLLADPKVSISTDLDFTDKLHKLVYSAIYNLYNSGVTSITSIDIDNYLSKFTVNYEYYKKKNGLQYLNDAEDFAQTENFWYYYDRFKKLSALRTLKKSGYDISPVYNEKVTSGAEEIEMEKKFEEMRLSDIFDKIKGNLDTIEKMYRVSRSDRTSTAHENIDELLNSFRSNPEVGYPLYNDIMNTVVRGKRKGKMYLSSSTSGSGKAIPVDTILPTVSGYRKAGDIKVGDYLFGRNGFITQVRKVYPQPDEKEIWIVKFEDGRITQCCEDHLWQWYDEENERNISSTKEIAAKLAEGRKAKIPLCEALSYPDRKLSIDPYLMGIFLNKGNFYEKKLTLVTQFEETVEEVEKISGWKREHADCSYCWNFKDSSGKLVLTEQFLREYPSLINTGVDERFIPSDFLYAGVLQRKALFQGLIGISKIVDKEGSYVCGSAQMQRDFATLCYELGYKAKMYSQEQLWEKPYFLIDYTIVTGWNTNQIVSITPSGEYAQMVCFTVDRADGLFIGQDAVVLHNTRAMVGEMCHTVYPYRYDRTLDKWIEVGNGQKALIILTEMEAEEIQTMIPAYLADINEEHILQGRYSADEEKRLECAKAIIKKYPYFYIEQIVNPDVLQLQSVIRYYIQNFGTEYIYYDYIFSSTNLLNEYRDLKIREDVSLLLLSNGLKEMATEYNVYVRTATQLNANATETEGMRKPILRNQNMLRGSKAIADKIDVGYITMPVLPEEEKRLEPVCKKLYMPMPTHVSDIYKNRRGRYTNLRIWHSFDLGTCRMTDLFATDINLEPVGMQIVKYVFNEDEKQYTTEELMAVLNGQCEKT